MTRCPFCVILLVIEKMPQGSFLEKNTYVLHNHVPWYVTFVLGGDLSGRTDPFFDSSLEISPDLLSEWYHFHNSVPKVGLHFPLDGDDLLRAMIRLGLGSHTLATGTAAYLSTLRSVVPFFQDCFIPVVFLDAIRAEIVGRSLPFPETGRQRTVRGAWLSPEPQSQWSRQHTDSKGNNGYLWYAPVYGVKDANIWDRQVDIVGHKETPRAPPHFLKFDDWLASLRVCGIRVIPVLAATENLESQKLAMEAQEIEEPRGLFYQNSPNGIRSAKPEGWWELSRGHSLAQLRLE